MAEDPQLPPPDAAARREALDPGRSFIVQAPAGSGKTTLLTQRYLALLASVQRPEAVVAITFTRKAAAEMRERVIEALERAAAGAPARHAADAATLELARAALAHAHAANWCLREQPGRLRIQTIDSLNHWLAGRLPILSGAGASLEIAQQADELYALAAERTLAEIDTPGPLSDALALVLGHFDNEVARVESLLGEMLSVRDRWLRLMVPGEVSGEALRAALEDALGHLLLAPVERLRSCLPDDAARALEPLVAGAAGRLGATDPNCARLALSRWPYAVAVDSLGCWQAFANLLLTGGGTWRKQVDVRQGFPREDKVAKAAFLGLLAHLGAVDGLERALGAVQRLPPARYGPESARVLEALHTVLLAAAARLVTVFAERSRVDFSAIAQAALAALGSPEEPSELTLELDYRIEHVLVDECQDTSAPQVALLERLTGGWQPGDGRTLFLVGDPMQSIYSFREADVGLFLKIRRDGLGAIDLKPLTLEANFRSRPGLVDWFNTTFARVLPASEDFSRGAVSYAPSRAVRSAVDGAAVQLALLPGGRPADEARRVVEIIERERAAAPGARIAVLGRSRGQLMGVASRLAAAGVRYQGVDLVPLAERPAVRDLLALTRALLHLADRVAWFACLRAPWCGLEFDALAALAARDDGHWLTLWEAMQDPARLAALAPSQAARLARVRGVLGLALADRGRRPLAALVESAWFALGGPATLAEAADLENARGYFARLDELERAGDLDDPAALEDRLGNLYAAPDPEAGDALQLLTVHKAKGLEWDVVILTGIGRTTRPDGQRLLEWLEYTREDAGPRLVLAPHPARATGQDPLNTWLHALQRERSRLELGRLAYVAATRAQERLYLVAHGQLDDGESSDGLKTPHPGSLLATLWCALAPAFTVAAAGEPAAGAVESAPTARGPLSRLADDWLAPPVEAPGVAIEEPLLAAGPSEFEFEWVTASARHVGSVVHEELERIATRGLPLAALLDDRRAARRRRLVELGVGPQQLDAALDRVDRALAATAADARGAWLFDGTHLAAASELGLSTISGGRVVDVRIDRTFIDRDGVRWIVDYKTSQHEGADVEDFLDRERLRYTPQLERYATLQRAREPGRAIRLGLYFPLLGGWREWASGEAPAAPV